VLPGGAASAALIEVIEAQSGYLAEVSAGLLERLSDADVLAELRAVGVLRRRLAVADHALIGELGRRSLPARPGRRPACCQRSTPG
jgi:hypothetical protein